MADKDFERRVKMAELLLKEQELRGRQNNEAEKAKANAEAELIRQLTEMGSANAQPQEQ